MGSSVLRPWVPFSASAQLVHLQAHGLRVPGVTSQLCHPNWSGPQFPHLHDNRDVSTAYIVGLLQISSELQSIWTRPGTQHAPWGFGHYYLRKFYFNFTYILYAESPVIYVLLIYFIILSTYTCLVYCIIYVYI